MYLNIVVIVVCFVASVMLSLSINVFVCTIAMVKHDVLIFVNALYKSPLLLVLMTPPWYTAAHHFYLALPLQSFNVRCECKINW